MTDVLLALNELEKLGKPISNVIDSFVKSYDLSINYIYFIIYIDETLTITDIQKIIRRSNRPWFMYRNSIVKAIDYNNTYILNKLLDANVFLPDVVGDKIIWGRFFERWTCFEFINQCLINECFECFEMIFNYYSYYVNNEYGVVNFKKSYCNGSLMYELWSIIVNFDVSNEILENIIKYFESKDLIFKKNLKDYNRFEYFITFSRRRSIIDRVKILKKYDICLFMKNEKIKKKLDKYYNKDMDELYKELELVTPDLNRW